MDQEPPQAGDSSRSEGERTSGVKLSEQSIVTVTKDQVSCSLGAEAAILNTKQGIYYGLDAMGAQIWKLLQAPRRIGDIREALVQEYDVEPARCQSDLLELLEDLLGAGLIEVR